MPRKILDLSEPDDHVTVGMPETEKKREQEWQLSQDAQLIIDYTELVRDKKRLKAATTKALEMAKETKKRADRADQDLKANLKRIKSL